MEDCKRAEKLSAARKLLKEHQKKSKKPNEASLPDNKNSANPDAFELQHNETDHTSVPNMPNLSLDNDTSSIASSKGSCNNVGAFFSNPESSNVNSDPQQFFDQISQSPNFNGFNAANGSSNNGSATEATGDYKNQSFSPQSVNGQNMSQVMANYHQYYSLYNDALQKINWYEQQLESTRLLGEQRLNQAVTGLQEKIQFQCRSLEMILSEKSDLQRQVEVLQEENKARTASCEELTNRLKASRNHVSRLENELAEIQEARTQHNSILKKLETNVLEHKVAADRYRTELEETKQEVAELKKSLDSAGCDHALLEKKLSEKESQLSLALIKIQQLGVDNPQSMVTQSAQAAEDIESLNQRIADLIKESEQSSQQYQEYINNINIQLQETTSMYESSLVVKEEQMQRIANLVDHVSDLEKQIQKHSSNIPQSTDLIEKNSQIKQELEKSHKRISELESQLTQEKAKLEETVNELTESKNEVGMLEDRLERLSGEVPDAKLLQAAMESDKVAAARAISQNTQLKQQLQELQDAFIKLQNTKLELTEQLDLTKHQCIDLQEELSVYIKKEVSRSDGSTEMNKVSMVDGCCQTTYYDLESVKPGETETVTPEAAAMLEDKFKTTMNKLAQVLDEKQVLEHLVTKLQSETETIGEYVALYQMQRCKLEKREIEKDQIVAAISKEKEDLRAKLAEITALIPSLVNRESHLSVGEEAVEELPTEVKEESSANEAASKIMSLLSEIGTSHLVKETGHSKDECISTFHPCALCSGSLITV